MRVKITVLAGGVGGARFLLAVRAWARLRHPDARITAVVNTADDLWLAGLRITPDLDSIMYALAGINDTERGWGRVGESERVSAELRAWGAGWPWFTLGDLDLGAHITRTAWLRDGVPLHEAVARLAARWDLGVRLLPATDDEVETRVRVRDDRVQDDEDSSGADSTRVATRTMHFQEWWTRYRAAIPALAFELPGVERAAAAPGVLSAIDEADLVLVAPSNPVVSIGTILTIPDIRAAVAATPAPVVGVSPIIGGAVVRGMADACLTAIGVATTAEAVGRHYGARAGGAGGVGMVGAAGSAGSGILDGWLVDEVDAASIGRLAADGIRSAAVPLLLRDDHAGVAIVDAAVSLASVR